MDELIGLLREALDLDEDIDGDTPLLTSGLVDSFGVIVVLGEIEARYGIVIEPEDVDADRFDTPRQILARVQEATG